MKKLLFQTIVCVGFMLLSSCGAYLNQPLDTTRARIGESTSTQSNLIKEFLPVEQVIVGVYKFRDQTGQYKPTENGSTFSTAVTQGGTSILLKSLEESKWFKPIERENIANLLNERQIIRSTRQEYQGTNSQKMPPLLFAGIILEGGVVSYDSNIITGGSGVRYFGAGASNQYRQDRITIYLRAVSTSNGQILKNIYVSKTILSQGISANLYRYVALRRLLEVETGVTKNEPAQLAVKEAIDKAVEQLIIEGVKDGLWMPQGGQPVVDLFKKEYVKEKKEADNTLLFNRKQETRRARNSMSATAGMSMISGDYSKSVARFGFDLKFKYLLKDPRFSFGGSVGRFELENERAFKNTFLTSSLNFEYNILPYDRFTPYLYVGIGSVVEKNLDNPIFKYQFGLGLEYLITNKIGLIIYGENNQLGSDSIDTLVRGEKNDFIWRVGAGLNVYF
ncbi:CsgG/HfaB family protein [Tenacibaculum bernardetii]|uniref:CsgG/HfaB family protein n=1 Tax=Tenacibaculum bernardetii TaxID=3021375 RepID=UPI0023B08B19|nr:CsgG/HfaB family protein [Tenacibaculum bernardetii]